MGIGFKCVCLGWNAASIQRWGRISFKVGGYGRGGPLNWRLPCLIDSFSTVVSRYDLAVENVSTT